MNSLVHFGTGEILVKKLAVIKSFGGRLKGLLFRRRLDADSALLLVATNRVHTFGMLFPIDLYFFDNSLVLIGARRRVMPWRLPLSPRGTEYILEVQYRPDVEPIKIDPGEKVSILWKVRS